jgi:hypothetical protein
MKIQDGYLITFRNSEKGPLLYLASLWGSEKEFNRDRESLKQNGARIISAEFASERIFEIIDARLAREKIK